jgi:hypothetical protein
MQAVLDRVKPDPAQALRPAPLDLPSPADVLYPDLDLTLTQVPAAFPESPDPNVPAPAQTFIVDSMMKMDWCVSKIIDAEARNARRAELAATLHERVDAWLTKASTADNDTIAYLTSLLRPFAISEIAKQRRSRTLLLPSGSVSLKKLPDKLDITDTEAAMAWASENAPSAIIIKKELSRSVLKSLIVSQGEAVPGCEFSLGPDELYVRANA